MNDVNIITSKSVETSYRRRIHGKSKTTESTTDPGLVHSSTASFTFAGERLGEARHVNGSKR